MADYDQYAPHQPQTTYGPRLCDVLNYGYDLGMQDYPIFDEEYRDTLNQKIINHFYTREIGAETPALFIFWLNRQLAERMPQINAVYKMINERDPLTTATSSTSGTVSGDSTTTDKSESDTTAKTYNSNAPQVSMVGKDEVDYYDTGATSTQTASASAESSTGSSQQTSGTTEQSSGPITELISSWYDGYNNGDLLVFDALEPCFMQIYQPGYIYF